jgi:drug/metabolite transporter (DMT)-like permease
VSCASQPATVIAELPSASADEFVGIGAVVAAGTLFGTNAIFAKLSYGHGMALFALVWLRYLLPLVILGPLALRARRRDPAPLPLRSALLIAIPYLGSSATYLASVKLGPVNQIAPFLYLYPAMLAVVGRVFFAESLSRRMMLAIVLGVGGSALLVGFDGSSVAYLPAKLIAVLSAAFAAVFYTTGSRLVPERQTIQNVAAICVVSSIVFAPVVLVTHANLAFPHTIPYVVVMAIGGSAIGLLLLTVGMRRLGATQASLLSLVEPIVTLTLALVVLGEATKPVQLVGTVMVLMSFPLARIGRPRAPAPIADLPSGP